jgi:hypothetical protein
MRTLIDGYPLPDDDPDFDIQLRINDYLSGPANERSWGSTAGRVMKGTSTPEERYRWLMPLLRRAEWLLEHPEGARPHWAFHLTCAVELLLNHNRQQSEQELLALLGYSSVFRRTNMTGALDEIAPRAVEALRKTADKRLWVEALENACFELEQFETVFGGRSAAQLGLALMIDPAAPSSRTTCWSAIVAEGLRETTKTGEGWRALLALTDTQLLYPREPKEKQVAAALKKVGPAELANRLGVWTAPLDTEPSAYLSWRGVALLKILLHAAAVAAIPELQPSLIRLAQANWIQADRAKLALDLLVRAIVTQPPAFSRTCLQLLATQPYAAENAALNVALSTPRKQDSPLGVDGYPLDSHAEQAIFQHRLDEWLRLPQDSSNGYQTGPDLRSLALREEHPDYAGLLTAMLDRIDWLARHSALIPENAQMKKVLSRCLPDLQRLISAVDRSSLLRLMQADTEGVLYCSPGEHILATVERYIETNGFDLELVNAIDRWHKAAHGSIAEQTLRRHLGWLLWREDVKPVDLKSCWSARIREDLRDMPEAQAKLWRSLLAPMTFHICDKPPAKWKKQVSPLLAAVGAEEFATWFHRWFRPFGQEQPLPLEAPGSDLLRCLLWHAAEIEGPKVDEALSWFPKARWNSKKSRSYTTKLMGPFVFTLTARPPVLAHACLEALVEKGDILNGTKNFEAYRALCERLGRPCREGIAPRAATTMQDLAIQTLKKMGCEVTEEAVVVRGQIESYIVDRGSREIRRLRDGALLQIETNGQVGPESEMIAQMFEQVTPAGPEDLRALLPLVQVLKMDKLFGRFLKVSHTGS